MSKIWIDTKTATWGNNPQDIVLVDLHDALVDRVGVEETDILESLDNASDTAILEFAEMYGIPIDTLRPK